MINVAFLGTPSAAVPALAALADLADVRLVVTRPDSAKGRSSKRSAPPVKLAADEWGFSVQQPESHAELHSALSSTPLDVAVVVAYGRILKAETLALAEHGFVNLHFSLLPRWRGAAPVERAILAGDTSTGVSLMKLDAGLDTGPVIAEVETPIAPYESGGALTARLASLGADLLGRALQPYVNGDLVPAQQLGVGAVHAARLTTAEARLSSDLDADDFARAVRAFNPRPGAWLELEKSRFRVLEAVEAPGLDVPPGIIEQIGNRVVAGVDGSAVELLKVQPAGKKPQDARSWMNGRRGMRASFE